MAQADGVVANGTGSAVRSDINTQYAALWSNHSGSTEPSSGKVAYQLWADTNTGYLKIRNAANNAWIQLFKLDGTDLANICRLTGSTNNQITTVTGANAIQGEANLTFDGSKLVIPSTGSNDANSNSDGAGFSSGSLHLRTRGATAGIAGTDYSNQIISNNGATVALEIFTTGSNSGTPVVFGTGGVQRARVETNGNFTISDGDLVIGTAGHGIDFSANSHASGMTSETLDGYEEGTFTPTDGSGASLSFSNTSGNCHYTKTGRTVVASFRLTFPSTSNTTQAKISGLPFSGLAATNFTFGVAIGEHSDDGSTTMIMSSSDNFMLILHCDNGVDVRTNAECSGKDYRGTVTYQAA